MRVAAIQKFFLPVVITFCALSVPILAQNLNNNEVEFTGVISSVVVNGEGVGALFVHVENTRMRVVINSSTTLENQGGQPIAMSDLDVGETVKITGKFSAAGILASEVRLLIAPADDFQLRGHITNVQIFGDDTLISLLGIPVVVNAGTQIQSDGAPVPASDLQVGAFVRVTGKIVGNTWAATFVEILSEEEKIQVSFEGIIRSVTPQLISVLVDGTTGTATVRLDENTRIRGTLASGVLILVRGTLNSDLSVTAKDVRVLQALEIKPDERKMRVDGTATFTVKLRESAPADVTVLLTSSDAGVLTLSANSVTIQKGSKAADFSATALKIGTAVITAEGLGQKATAQVTVGRLSEEEGEDESPTAVRVLFAPDHIRMNLNDTRDVVLIIQPPQKSTVSVQFTVSNNIVNIAGSRDFNNGAAALKVAIQSGSQEGTASVIATLPASLGGGKAELLVEVSGRIGEQERAQINFRPDDLKLFVNESRTVNLFLGQPLATDVAVNISGGGSVVQVPAAVVVPAGSRQAQVSVIGKSAGKVNVIAALPASLGGAGAKLEVEVKNRK
ncbi:MAG: hypothetical protein HY644_03720 [Acidobacteria bacterium]|nr:hypothetical protein [Acidobacteriota bacterium]